MKYEAPKGSKQEEIFLDESDESLWDEQRRLAAEYKALVQSGATQEAIDAKIIEVNNHVATLVNAGEVADEDGWVYGIGFNPNLDDPDQHSDF